MNKIVRLMLFNSLLLIFNIGFAKGLPNLFNNVIYFGDSLTDVGNYKATNPGQCNPVDAPTTNKTGSSSPYTNGYLWANYLANDFGLPAVQPSNSDPANNDWAYSSAMTFTQSFSVSQQVKHYLANSNANPNELYAIWAGNDDLLFRILLHNPPITNPNIISLIVDQGVNNIIYMIGQLETAGAHNFLIISIPDLSKTPLGQAEPSHVQAEMQKLVSAWNGLLLQRIKIYQSQHPVTIYYENTYNLIDKVVNKPLAYDFPPTINGFANNAQFWCDQQSVHPNADEFMFFNAIHPTTHAQAVIAQDITTHACQVNVDVGC